MSKNLAQVFAINPVTTIGNTDLFYMSQAGTTDGGISGLSLRTTLGTSFLQIANNLSDLNNAATARTNLGLGTMATQSAAAYLLLSGGTMTGVLNMGASKITNMATPTVSSDSATKGYVDSQIVGQTPLLPAVFSASTANLSGWTYNNGTAGVGATLTAPTNGLFIQDGFTVPVGERWFYKDDATGSNARNGIYIVTTSAIGSQAVLTRSADYNTPGNMLKYRVINVDNGTLNGGAMYSQTSIVTTVGTDPVTYFLLFNFSLVLQPIKNLSDLQNIATARTNLGLGTAAVQNNAFFLQTANNLIDIPNITLAQANLGLGTMATQSATDYLLLAGGTMTGGLTNNVSVTTPIFQMVNHTGSVTNAFTWQTGNVYPLFGPNAMTLQSGAVTAGHLAVWNATATLQDGGILPGTLINIQTLTSITSATFTKTTGARSMLIYAQGAGGGGGGGQAGVSCGAGGNSGALGIWQGPSQNFTYICGKFGAGGKGSTTGIGGVATATIITTLPTGTITVNGGDGGLPGTTVPGFATLPSTVPLSVGASINIPGKMGNFGILYTATFVQGGMGAGTMFGTGGLGGIVSTASVAQTGANATGTGAGGGGAAFVPTGTSPNGGDGAPATIYVFEYS